MEILGACCFSGKALSLVNQEYKNIGIKTGLKLFACFVKPLFTSDIKEWERLIVVTGYTSHYK